MCWFSVPIFNDVISFLVDWLGTTPMGVQLQSHKDHWSLCCSRAFIRFVKTNKAYDLIVARYKWTPTVFGEQGCPPLPMGELEQGYRMFDYAICVMYMYVGKQKHENDGWFKMIFVVFLQYNPMISLSIGSLFSICENALLVGSMRKGHFTWAWIGTRLWQRP